jgi:hypothetical protein
MNTKLPSAVISALPSEYRVKRTIVPIEEQVQFLDFCITKLGITANELVNELEELGIRDLAVRNRYAEILEELGKNSLLNNTKGNFGEAQAEWFLSEREQYLVIRAGWEQDPFERKTGIDIVGIDPAGRYLSYIESKAPVTSSSFPSMLHKLVDEQLPLKRLRKQFGSKFSKGGFTPVLKSLQNKLFAGTLEGWTQADLAQLNSDRFERVGVIVHGGAATDKLEGKLYALHEEELGSEGKHPTYLLAIEVAGIEDLVQRWAMIAKFAVESGL